MTGLPRFFPVPSDFEILILWRAGKDTNEISKQLRQPESSIAFRLPHILENARRDQEWNFDRCVSAAG